MTKTLKPRKARTYASDALASAHEAAADLHEAGLVDKQTLRRFDDACLTEVRPFGPEDIQRLRAREQVSQAVFAAYLNVTAGLVSKWERGDKKPKGPSLKLLNLVDRKGLDAVA